MNNVKMAAEYFTGNLTAFNQKDDDYKNLFLAYATDANSSTIRELATLYLLGYDFNLEKHGHDGVDSKTGKLKEVKPRYIKAGDKLGSSGNFNDMTLDLLETKEDYDVICSMFTEDKLIYVVEFPFSAIYERIKKPILEAKLGKRVVCHFRYNDYNINELVVHYFDAEAARQKNCLSKPHYDMLKNKQDGLSTKLFERP